MAPQRKRRRVTSLPQTVGDLIMAGGPERLARQAAQDAAKRERQFWLKVLESRLDGLDGSELMTCLMYVRGLRRKLGKATPKKEVREQTRERVRQFRARRAQQS